MLYFLIALFVIGCFNWYLVFNEAARRRLRWPSWYWYWVRRSKEDREIEDAMSIATSLVIAVVCSSLILVALIIGLVNLFK